MPKKTIDDGRPWMSRKLLGNRLRSYRDAIGKTRADVAAARGGLSPAHLRSIEVGEVPIHVRNVKTLCDIYGVHDEKTRNELCDLGEATRKRGWYSGHSIPAWMGVFADIESQANVIHHYLEYVIDGRFQTEDYARAVTKETIPPDSTAKVEDVVDFRMTRKKKFWSSYQWKSFDVVFMEAALTIEVGSPKIQQAQIQHLLEMSERPGVTVSVVPRTAGPYFGMGNPLMIFDFDDDSYPSVVWDDLQVKSGFNDDIKVVDRCRTIWQCAQKKSVSLKRFVDDYWQ